MSAWLYQSTAALVCVMLALTSCGTGEDEEDGDSVVGFGEGGVVLPYSATPVGSSRCLECHTEVSGAEPHHMAQTGSAVTRESQLRWFSDQALARPIDQAADLLVADRPRYRRTDRGVFLEHGDSSAVEVQAVFGSGVHGFTPIGTDGRVVRELSVSYLAHRDVWILTPGQENNPDALGRALVPEDGERCLGCHMTQIAWRADGLDPEQSVFGVQCERCHGPGSAHVEAVESGLEENLVFSPGSLSPKEQVEFCGQCHRKSSDLDPREILAEKPANARHAGAGLMLSACFRKSPSEATITCTDCHNPHRNIAPQTDSFDDACIRCHVAPDAEHEDLSITSSASCVDCHMGRRASLGDIEFTNHWIRNSGQERRLSDARRHEYMSHMDSVYRDALRAPALGPRARADLYMRSAQADLALGNMGAALADYEQALASGPRYEASIAIAEDFIRMGMSGDAIKILEDAVASEPRLSAGYHKLVRQYAHSGDFTMVERVVERWSETMPESWHLGVTLMSMGRLDQAEEEFERVLQLVPSSAPAHHHLGNVRVLQGRLSGAIAHYRRAVEIDPDYVEVRIELGQSLGRTGSEREAIDHLRRVLEHSPDSGPAHTELGLVQARLGEHGDASDHFHRALAIDSTLAKAHWGLGTVHESTGNMRDAVERYRKALVLSPNPVLAGRLAWILATADDVGLRDGAEAVRLASQVADLTGYSDPVVLNTLVAAYAEAGEGSKARETARRALRLIARDETPVVAKLRASLETHIGEEQQ